MSNFVVRLTDEADKNLDALMQRYNESTKNKAVIKALNGYLLMENNYKELRQKHVNLQREYDELKQAILSVNKAQERLQRLISEP